jgi:hypothetical protein
VKSLVVLALLTLAAASARADNASDAAAHAKHAEVLYNLGKFADAAAELEKAYELDPDVGYLFNLASAYRMAGNLDRAAFVLRRYIDTPDATQRAEAQTRLDEIEANRKAAAANAASGTIAELAHTKADLAAAQARIAELEKPKPLGIWRIGLESGTSEVYIVGSHTHSSTAHGRIRVMHRRRFGNWTVEDGSVWDIIWIPYTYTPDGSGSSVVYTTLVFQGDVFYQISEHWFVGGGLGVGFNAYSGMRTGNPFGLGGMSLPNDGSLAGRADFMFGYKLSDRVDAVAETAVSGGWLNKDPDHAPAVTGVVDHDVISLGLHVVL